MRAIYKAMFATHEALRRLGFPPEEIFAMWAKSSAQGQPRAATALRAQGKQFVVDYPKITTDLPESETAFRIEYESAANAWLKVSHAEGEANYRAHYDVEELSQLAMSIYAKGISIPKAGN